MDKAPATVEELDKLCKQLAELDKQLDAQENATKELNKKKFAIQTQFMLYLKELKRTEYDSPHGKFKMTPGWRVNMPADDKAKMALFEHLKKTPGLFEQFATVNSNTLNAYYRREWEIAKQQGPDAAMAFEIPGILAPKEEIKPKFKPTKTGEDNDEQSASDDNE